MALSIYNAISDEDIIKGRNIAGTGTIDIDGNVVNEKTMFICSLILILMAETGQASLHEPHPQQSELYVYMF